MEGELLGKSFNKGKDRLQIQYWSSNQLGVMLNGEPVKGQFSISETQSKYIPNSHPRDVPS